MNTFTWLVKREYWEHRGGFKWVPLITGGVLVLMIAFALVIGLMTANRHGIVVGNLNLDAVSRAATPEQLKEVGAAINVSLYMLALPISALLGIVSFFYLLGSLYDERRDRSILFWKSLPVSDVATVLSKVVTVTLVAPALALIATFATLLVFLVLLSIVFAIYGINPFTTLWLNASPLSVMVKLVALVPINAIWALPTIGWLMLCSAFARRVPFLWAVLIPVGTGTVLAIYDSINNLSVPSSWFWENIVARILLSIMPGGWIDLEHVGRTMERAVSPTDVATAVNTTGIVHALSMPTLWIGAVAGAGMIAGAIWLRRWRDDS
jgi:ABC-2 type transport system permease protein